MITNVNINDFTRENFWKPKEGCSFFGNFYITGDNSLTGYLSQKKQTLAERTEEEVNGILNLTNFKKETGFILDIPCGYGRHSNLLARKGFRVVGIDINTEHLDKAIDDGRYQENRVRFIEASMLEWSKKEYFSLAINMFYSFGFFMKDEDNQKSLKNIFYSLKKGGKFLFHTDVNMPNVLGGNYKFFEERLLPDDKTLVIKEEYVKETKRMEGTWSIFHKTEQKILNEKGYSMRVYSQSELESLFKTVGFKNILTFGNWEGDPCLSTSEMMIMVGQK